MVYLIRTLAILLLASSTYSQDLDRIAVIVDSGFRRGSDILKGLALGADAVIIGRATLYGAAAAGEDGAYRALDILQKEILRTMGVMGLTNLKDISRGDVVMPHEYPL